MRRFAIIGLGQLGANIALTLARRGAVVLALDSNEARCDSLKSHEGIQPLCLDATDERAMRASGVDEVEAAVVAIRSSLDASVRVTAILRRLAVPQIIARASDDLHAEILERTGATQVVRPDRHMGEQLAERIFSPDMHERQPLAHGLHWIEVDARQPFWGRSLEDLSLLSRFDVKVVAIKRRVPAIDEHGENRYEQTHLLLPHPSESVEQGDILIVLGSESAVDAFLSF